MFDAVQQIDPESRWDNVSGDQFENSNFWKLNKDDGIIVF